MTVRARVTALATLAVVVVLVVSGAVLIALQRETLTSALDESLMFDAEALVADLASGVPATLDPRGDEDVVAQLVLSFDGSVLASSRNLRVAPRVSSMVPPDRGDRVVTATVPTRKGDHRLLARRVALPNARAATLYFGAPLDDVTDPIATLTRSMLAAVPLMAAILAGLVWWLVGRTLRPVEEIRARVAGMRGTDTDKRVPEPSGDDEIARLARTMNAMLDRVEDAVARQQRFVADASHELRTPLARMRAEVEVDLRHPDGADPAATHRSVLEELTALQQLVEDLLVLARADAGVRADGWTTVGLGALVREEVANAATDGIAVDVHGAAEAPVSGDAEQLRRVVRNLAQNALRYARTRVTIEVTDRGDGGVRLTVSDDGPGVAIEDRERIFERFARVDDARAAGTGGAGLGLAIAREIVERHGGSISATGNGSSGASFEVVLPRAAE